MAGGGVRVPVLSFWGAAGVDDDDDDDAIVVVVVEGMMAMVGWSFSPECRKKRSCSVNRKPKREWSDNNDDYQVYIDNMLCRACKFKFK